MDRLNFFTAVMQLLPLHLKRKKRVGVGGGGAHSTQRLLAHRLCLCCLHRGLEHSQRTQKAELLVQC